MTNKDINVPINDCVSREAAIDDLHGKDPSQIWDTADIEVWVNALPPAQPERLTDDDFETVRIHLNAYKERLCNQHRWKEAEEYQRIINRFMSFASAQPEKRTDKRTETHACDCISRQAAIDLEGNK